MSGIDLKSNTESSFVAEANSTKVRHRAIYLVLGITMLLVTSIVCFNYIKTIREYNKLQNGYQAAWNYIIRVDKERSGLNTDNQSLVSENEDLKEQIKLIQKNNLEYKKQLEQMKIANVNLTNKTKQFNRDNIALQNTLKIAASVGVKPQNYKIFKGLASNVTIKRGSYVGSFVGTAYTPSIEECGNDKGITYSGLPIIPGISIAVDTKYWPIGTVFYIKGLGYSIAMDTGSAIKGRNRFDFSVFDKKFAKALGIRNWEVYLIKKGDGSANNINLSNL